ncbi:hypothetical protein C7477_11167 [Phyllobacterium leguminum]|uniref:Lytic murein transglycosylase n=1 Tax=Phyllobacterium leguminum TaxID=314237 RepID=A0A318T5Y4_9HYPH|nr:hypothetical protein C7477_11167 [Phyllobacterium leguminum]
MLVRVTPLCPAGHLPLKGGDYAFINARHQSQMAQDGGRKQCQPISLLEGEMPGRAEGGIAPTILQFQRDMP